MKVTTEWNLSKVGKSLDIFNWKYHLDNFAFLKVLKVHWLQLSALQLEKRATINFAHDTEKLNVRTFILQGTGSMYLLYASCRLWCQGLRQRLITTSFAVSHKQWFKTVNFDWSPILHWKIKCLSKNIDKLEEIVFVCLKTPGFVGFLIIRIRQIQMFTISNSFIYIQSIIFNIKYWEVKDWLQLLGDKNNQKLIVGAVQTLLFNFCRFEKEKRRLCCIATYNPCLCV